MAKGSPAGVCLHALMGQILSPEKPGTVAAILCPCGRAGFGTLKLLPLRQRGEMKRNSSLDSLVEPLNQPNPNALASETLPPAGLHS